MVEAPADLHQLEISLLQVLQLKSNASAQERIWLHCAQWAKIFHRYHTWVHIRYKAAFVLAKLHTADS
jgi:hypothetical protein